jgi:MGT family glycosyltransferase
MRLAFFNIPAHGHVNPTLPVVAELVRRGVEVSYICAEPYRARVEAIGATFHAYPSMAQDLAPSEGGAVAPFLAMRSLLEISAELLPGLIEDVRTLKPDAVIYDSMTVWGKQVGQALGLPVICSCAIFLVCARNLRAMPRDTTAFAQAARNVHRLVPAVLGYRRAASHIKRGFGLPSPAPLDFCANPGDMTVVFASREFTAGADLLDDTFKYVGVSIAPRGDAGDFPLEALSGKPVVYVLLGTLFNKQAQFFRNCIAAFRDQPYHVVMSIGKTVQVSELGDIPTNFIVRPFVPQLEVLQRATAFITHGGMNSTSEALWFGVPMVVVPQVGDQVLIAKRVEQLGAGCAVNTASATPEAIRSAVERVLSQSSFRQRSAGLGDSLRAAGGYARAADEVCAFVER